MMLNPKITNCKECASIVPLIEEINCKIADMSHRLYNNIVFSLNLHIAYMDMLDLLNYRRVLQNKLVNPSYICDFTVAKIASKVKLLTTGCKTKCPCSSGPTLTTTSTTTLAPITTTTTTLDPVTTTTTTSISTSTTTSTTTIVPITTTTTTSLVITTTTTTPAPGTTTTTTTPVPTTTTTTTPVPTTTTTTTAVAVFSVDLSDTPAGNHTASCGQVGVITITYYYMDPVVIPTTTVLYLDPGFTTVLAGGNSWYFDPNSFTSFQVAPNGVVLVVHDCNLA